MQGGSDSEDTGKMEVERVKEIQCVADLCSSPPPYYLFLL
jgi:hypothetical protein